MIEKIQQIWSEFVDFMYRLLLTVFDFLKDFFFWVIEQLMQGAIYISDGLGAGLEGLNPTQYFNQLPAETMGMLAMVGFNECMTIIVSAIGIRLLLQLIPFVRWGS